MTTWFVGGGRSFDPFFVNLYLEDSNFFRLSEKSFADQLQKYILSCRKDPAKLIIIVDVSCKSCIKIILTLLRLRGGSDLSELRIVALSTFETWGGRHPKNMISDVNLCFRERVPLTSAVDFYALENELESLSQQNGIWLRIVGYGLFYGSSGMDLHALFMNMWDQEIETNPVHAIQCSKDLNVPVVNVETFVRFIKALAEGEVETNTTFVPALDSPVVENGAVLPLAAVIQRLDVILNGGKSMLGLGDSVASERTPLWRCHVPFASSPVPGNLLSEAHTLWAQFLQHNALQPLSLLVAGPPRLGKTEAVKQLAQSLKIEVVTLETAVRFLFGLKNGEGQPPDIAERVAAAHAELRAAVEAKATEGKKPAKGAPVLEEGVIDEAVFTLSFCQTLPVELLRRCVSAQVKLHRGCRRRGFVLDLWDGKTVLDADSLQEAINSILPPTADSCSSGLVDLVAELHCPSSLPVERLLASQGAQAKSKEAQAAVKALEAQVVAYVATLAELPPSVNSDADAVPVAAHMSTGLRGVQEILSAAAVAASSRSSSVCRVDCTEALGATADGIAKTITDAVMQLRAGRIGWLSPRASPATATVPQATVDAHANESVTAESEGESQMMKVLAADVQTGSSGLAEQVAQLDSSKQRILAARAAQLESFLTASVLPHLAAGLVQIQRQQPEDPILFLAEHLMYHSTDSNKLAQEKAHLRFAELLHQGKL